MNLRSETEWDLHFVGYEPRSRTAAPHRLGLRLWKFDPVDFLTMAATIEQLHQAAVGTSELQLAPWSFSGTADLVSFMAYRDLKGMIDWPSLHAVSLLDANGRYADVSLGSVVETMSDWRADTPELTPLALGELRCEGSSVLGLRSALLTVGGSLVDTAALPATPHSSCCSESGREGFAVTAL